MDDEDVKRAVLLMLALAAVIAIVASFLLR
jgi:hypothetical protein